MPDLHDQLRAASDPADTTATLQAAIDRAGATGGVVTIPPGTWTARTLHLRGGMALRLECGAVLQPDTDLSAYPTFTRGHNKDRSGYHFLVAERCAGLTIEGDGVIDGRGEAFWEPPIRDLKAAGEDVSDAIARAPKRWPVDGPFWRGYEKPRISPLLELRDCTDLVLRDVVIRNSPGWTVHPFNCDRVRIDGITIDNHMFGPNTDGIDVNGCRDVLITNCRIAGCDDNIIIKATEDARSCERIAVSNCTLRSTCAALGIGAECASGIRDIAFSNCVVEQALRMIQLQVWTAGVIERVAISNITGNAMAPAEVPQEKVVYMDVQYHHRYPREQWPLGHIRHVTIAGVTARTRGRCVLSAAEPGHIHDVTLRDIDLDYAGYEDNPAALKRNHSNQNSNSNPWVQQANAVVVAEHVDRLRLDNVRGAAPAPATGQPPVGLAMRGVRGAAVDCPWLKGHGEPPHDIDGCEGVDLRGLGGAL